MIRIFSRLKMDIVKWKLVCLLAVLTRMRKVFSPNCSSNVISSCLLIFFLSCPVLCLHVICPFEQWSKKSNKLKEMTLNIIQAHPSHYHHSTIGNDFYSDRTEQDNEVKIYFCLFGI